MATYLNDWVGQTLASGRYRVDAKLGEGGMGFVYKVWDRNLDADVVIKVPRRAMLEDAEFAARFAREIRSLVKLSHPHIVKVSDVGEHEGLPFAVMQYLPGGGLDERQAIGPLGQAMPSPPDSLAGWLPGVAAALDYIHREGYIHRDVKPANILFDAQGHAFLGDFGIAKVLGDAGASPRRGATVTGAGMVLGTPEYMAPELIMAAPFDGRVDQFALAATAYEMLCGRKSCSGDSPTAILVRQTSQPPSPMTEMRGPNAVAIARVVFKGLAKDPDGRFASCDDFARALLEAAGVAPARTSPARTPTPAQPRGAGKLACPACAAEIPTPPAVQANPAIARGKKTTCPACSATLRFADQGLSLVLVNGSPTPSSSFETPAARPPVARTMVERPPVGARPPVARTVVERPIPARTPAAGVDRTVRLDALNGPIPAIDTSGPSPMAAPVVPAGPKVPVWAMVAGGVGVASLAALALGVFFMTRKPTEVAARVPSPNPIAGVAKKTKAIAQAPPIAPAPVTKQTPKPVPDPAIGRTPNPNGFGSPSESIAITSPPTDTARPGPGMLGATTTPPVMEEVAKAGEDRPEPEVVVEPGNGKDVSLEKLLAEPERYVGQVVSPNEMLRVDTRLTGRPGPDQGLDIECKHVDYQKSHRDDAPLEIVVEPKLADQIRELIGERKLFRSSYMAIVQIQVERRAGRKGKYRGTVDRIEFFLDMNEGQVAVDAIGKAFLTNTVTAEGSRVGLGKGEEWKKRFGAPYLNQVKRAWKAANKQMNERMFDRMQSRVASDSAAAASQFQRQQQQMIQKVWGR